MGEVNDERVGEGITQYLNERGPQGTDLLIRVNAEIASIEEMRAKATQGKWQACFLFRMFRAIRNHQTTLGMMLQGDDTKDWPDAETTASRVNSTEADLGLVKRLVGLIHEGCLPAIELVVAPLLADWLRKREEARNGPSHFASQILEPAKGPAKE